MDLAAERGDQCLPHLPGAQSAQLGFLGDARAVCAFGEPPLGGAGGADRARRFRWSGARAVCQADRGKALLHLVHPAAAHAVSAPPTDRPVASRHAGRRKRRQAQVSGVAHSEPVGRRSQRVDRRDDLGEPAAQ